MPFIPNASDAEDVSQAQVDSRDFDVILAALSGTGAVSGCAVTAQGTPNMTVAVASGTVAVASSQVSVTGGNVTITTAHASLPRFDLICVDGSGTKSAVAGTPATAPVFPDPAGKAVLAAVRVPAGVTSINNAKIIDKRVAPVVPVQAEPTGTIKAFAGSAAPSGWSLCDGGELDRTTYGALYAVVGTTYGNGNGTTTFNKPDARGRSLIGLGSHADVNALGKSDGLTTVANRGPKHSHSFAGGNLPNHAHSDTISFTDTGHTHSDTLGFTDPGHGHSLSGNITKTDTGHIHSMSGTPANNLTLPNHTHSDTLSFTDTGHTHATERWGNAAGGSNTSHGATVTASDPFNGYAYVNSASASISKSGSVGNPTTNPTIGGSIGIGTLAVVSNTTGITVDKGTLAVATGTVTLTKTGTVSGGSASLSKSGSVGNPTSNPAVTGTVGTGSGLTDAAPYLVINYIIKL